MGLSELKETIAFALSGPAMVTQSPLFLWNEKQVEFVAKRAQVVSKHYNLESVTDSKRTAIPFLIGSVVIVLMQQILIMQMMRQQKPTPAAEPATPSDAATNAGMAANGSIDLTGEHLKGIHLP